MGSRYVLGWGAVLALSLAASGGTLVLVRSAIGDGTLAEPLSQAQVHSQYADALHPGSTRSSTGSPTTTNAPTPTSGATSHPASTSSTQPTHPTSTSTGTGTGPGSATGTHPHPRPSGSSSSPSRSSPPPPPATITRVLTSPGGSVVVRCTAAVSGPGQVYLVSWSPAQGYGVDHAQRGPGEEAEIEFDSDQSSVSVHYHCTTSGPAQSIETGDGWAGGGDDGGGRDS